MHGKGGMVWKLRNWCGGDPARQVEDAKRLGLSRVSIKVTDGRVEKWEGGSRTNKDLLPGTVGALRGAGIAVDAWAWMKGYAAQWDWDRSLPVRCTPAEEAKAAIAMCHRFGIEHLQVDAEADYRGKSAWAAEWCAAANNLGPDLFLTLCSYRFPLTSQPDFPVRIFAPAMDGWSPQVYFLGDNRVLGGAIQLQESARQHSAVRLLPFMGVAPTYPAAGPWTASPAQLAAFGRRALELGHAGVSFWCLDLATSAQKDAIASIVWGDAPAPEPDLWRLLAPANLRTGPGVSFPVIRLVAAGTTFERLEVGGGVGGDWWKVSAGGTIGWVLAPLWKVQAI